MALSGSRAFFSWPIVHHGHASVTGAVCAAAKRQPGNALERSDLCGGLWQLRSWRCWAPARRLRRIVRRTTSWASAMVAPLPVRKPPARRASRDATERSTNTIGITAPDGCPDAPNAGRQAPHRASSDRINCIADRLTVAEGSLGKRIREAYYPYTTHFLRIRRKYVFASGSGSLFVGTLCGRDEKFGLVQTAAGQPVQPQDIRRAQAAFLPGAKRW